MNIVNALKAQINAMKCSMNRDYLVFMNITLFNEVIRKFISPQCSQYIIVASCFDQRNGTYQQTTLGVFDLQKRMASNQRRKYCKTKRTSNNGKIEENAETRLYSD